jgi:hypothetical protein
MKYDVGEDGDGSDSCSHAGSVMEKASMIRARRASILGYKF